MPFLHAPLDDDSEFLYEIIGPEVTVGRHTEADFVIESPFVSKRHAILKLVAPDVYESIDLGGKNGTYVNGVRVFRHTLRDKDEVHFGGQIRTTYLAKAPAKAEEDSATPDQEGGDGDDGEEAPVVRKLSADAFEGRVGTSPLDPNEFTRTQQVKPTPDEEVDPLDLLEAVIRRARSGEGGADLLADLERVRDLIGTKK